MQTLLNVGNLAAALGWLLLIAGCFQVRVRSAALILSGIVLPAAFCLTYLTLLAFLFSRSPEGGDLGSLAGLHTVFATDLGMVTGWYHYLAFDLFIGAWMVRDGPPRGISPWLLTPALILTFLAGPVGWLLYFGLRLSRGRGGPAAA